MVPNREALAATKAMKMQDKGGPESPKGSCQPSLISSGSERVPRAHTNALVEADAFFPLLKLPPELRKMIYLHAFEKHFLIRSTDYRISLKLERSMYSVCMECPEKWSWCHDSPIRVSSTNKADIAILLANRQISEEAAQVLYSTSTFHFDDAESLAVFLLATPERHLAIMTRLTITITLHPEQSVPALWVHYISKGVLFKMKQLKIFEVCIWATYPESHSRRSRQSTRLKNSKSMPFLERATVAVIGDKARKRKADRDIISPGRLAQDIVQLIKGKPSESH